MIPYVTCICVTKNRRNWLPKAIECFLKQTYENKELLILADGVSVKDLIPNDPRIVFSQMIESLSVGLKRNAAVAMAHSQYIAHWDDDDHSEPERLSDQMGRLILTGKSVTAYNSMKFTDGKRWWLYQGSAVTGIGTSLCYRREWAMMHPFDDKQVGEDNSFVVRAVDENDYIFTPANDFMYASIHPDNTSKRQIGAHYTLIDPMSFEHEKG